MEDSGELLKIIKPFGFTEQELSGNQTAEQLANKKLYRIVVAELRKWQDFTK